MPWAAAAATVAGAVISAESSKSAADKSASASKKASAQIKAAGDQARSDVLGLFGPAEQNLLAGSGGAFDIFNKALMGQQQALGQGNINAQQTLSSSLPQIQNALLGLPTNYNAFAPRGVSVQPQFASPFNNANFFSSIPTLDVLTPAQGGPGKQSFSDKIKERSNPKKAWDASGLF